MNAEDQARYDTSLRTYLKERVSRAKMLKASLAGFAVAAVPGVASAAGAEPSQTFPYFPSVTGTYTTETMQQIFDLLVTIEHIPVTVLSNVIPKASTIGINAQLLMQVQAILAEEAYHVQFLEGLGGTAQVDSYTLPPPLFADYNTLFGAVYAFDTLLNAAYTAAVREFAELGQPRVAKWMAQVGGVEAEHRAMARLALSQNGATADWPPADKAFETDHFVYVADFVTTLKGLGLIGGSNPPVPYPGVTAALTIAGDMAAAVQQQTPNDASVSTGPANDLTGQRGALPS